MPPLPVPARIYTAAVLLLGAALLVLRVPSAEFADPGLFLLLLALSCATATMKVALPLTVDVSTLPVSYTLDLTSLLLVGPKETMIIAAAGALCHRQWHRTEWSPLHRTLFSMASVVVTVELASRAFHLLSGPGTDPFTAVARPLVGAASVYFLSHTGLIASAHALIAREPIGATWRTNFLWSAPNYIAGATVAGLAAWAVRRYGIWIAPLTLAPIYVTYQTYKLYADWLMARQHVRATSDLHLATIEALAGAIDAKDQMAHAHIRRVQLYAGALAEASGLSALDIRGVQTAALLHDIGNLAVPEHILSKPGPLTAEEFQKVRIHPEVGAEIIAGVPFPYPVAPLIRSHHERWDGTGYPQGLVGEAIPIGARILSIVDYYDSVTSERPYHPPLAHNGAIRLMTHEAGRSFDPVLVDRFIGLLPGLLVQSEGLRPGSSPAVVTEAPQGEPTFITPEESRLTAFENIGLAHHEEYALYQIAQSMGTSLGVTDAMALISSKLRTIVPWSGCALYVYQPSTGLLHCRFVAGIDAPHLLDATVRLGDGLSGWVARNRRILVNANPGIEFDAAGIDADLCISSAIACPLCLDDTCVGVLVLFHTDPERYNNDHRRLMAIVAEQATAVIHNSILFERAQEDALTDPLTGLPNRRSMLTRLTRELARAERLRSDLALIVLDIDAFKQINDTHGHHVGDRALRAVASTLRDALRQYDLCFRFAGDEFIAVISELSEGDAETKRRELQQRIGSIELEGAQGQRIRLSASAGVAMFPDDGMAVDALIARADARMYADKSSRRPVLEPPLPFDEETWAANVTAGTSRPPG